MILKDFLISTGTEKNLTDLILLLSTQAQQVKNGFFPTCMKTQACELTRNTFGEEQMALDKYADSVFISGLKKSRLVQYIATEEQEQIIKVEKPKNNFGVVIDPLDGSSLIDVNLCIGSIIGTTRVMFLKRAQKWVAALYILYGPLTLLTFTTGKGVHEFVLDDTGEFVLKDQDIKIPDGKIYAPGALIAEIGIWPEQLELEITESSLMESSENTIDSLNRLRRHGFKIAIDDFGTGYSSLTYLNRFPIDRLKIDQSFVRDLDSDPDDAAIVSAIIAMARSLDLEIVAEGVENEAHRDFLLGLNCDEAQGFLYSWPLPPDEVEAILRAGVIDVMASS